jgi:hypothetical protein
VGTVLAVHLLMQTVLAMPCASVLAPDETSWVAFLRAVALRDGPAVLTLGRHLLEGDFVFPTLQQLDYAARATISAAIGTADIPAARALLQRFHGDMLAANTSKWTMDLLVNLANTGVSPALPR